MALSASTAYSQPPPSLYGVTVGASQKTKGSALRESVQVKVEHLDALMSAAAANAKPVLFLNGQEMKGVYGVEEYPGTLVFQLQRGFSSYWQLTCFCSWSLGTSTLLPRERLKRPSYRLKPQTSRRRLQSVPPKSRTGLRNSRGPSAVVRNVSSAGKLIC